MKHYHGLDYKFSCGSFPYKLMCYMSSVHLCATNSFAYKQYFTQSGYYPVSYAINCTQQSIFQQNLCEGNGSN